MFEQFDALLLARIQFAFTVSFHFIFPAFSIGLASYLAVLEGLWLRTGKAVYLDLFSFWVKIFAVAFALMVNRFSYRPLIFARSAVGSLRLTGKVPLPRSRVINPSSSSS